MNQMPPQLDYLELAKQGQLGGLNPQQQQQAPTQFDPRILEAMGLAQGYDAEDERIARQQAYADALREGGQNGGVDPRATSSKAMWAGALANIGKNLIGGYVRNRADKEQKTADQQRMQGMRDFSINYRGAEGQQPDGSFRVPFSPMRGY
jgi:hypothetical protein